MKYSQIFKFASLRFISAITSSKSYSDLKYGADFDQVTLPLIYSSLILEISESTSQAGHKRGT